MTQQPFVRVLGSAEWEPLPDNECAHYSVCDRILVDTGWGAAMNLMKRGLDPMAFDVVCLTHLHADHYMGLAQLLMYRRIKKGTLGDLTILGPAETVRAGIERAIGFILHDSQRLSEEIREMPRIVEMGEGDRFEAAGFCIDSIRSVHTVPGICYRMSHQETLHAVGFTGDTMYRPQFGAFFQGCKLLIHETTFGISAPASERTWYCLHSDAYDAIRVAREARVERLLLTHAIPSRQMESVLAARSQLTIPVDWAASGQIYPF